MGLDDLKDLADTVKVLLLEVSGLIWERRGRKEVTKSLLNIDIARGRTEFTRMQKAEGFFWLSFRFCFSSHMELHRIWQRMTCLTLLWKKV